MFEGLVYFFTDGGISFVCISSDVLLGLPKIYAVFLQILTLPATLYADITVDMALFPESPVLRYFYAGVICA